MRNLITVCALLVAWTAHAHAAEPRLDVVAAENFYGDLARAVGGDRVEVTSILSNPDQDPHLFEASTSTAKALAGARLVIMNGADYDPWMEKLLSASKVKGRKVLVVADLVHKKAGDNPHLWYQPATMPTLARALSADLAAADPAHKDAYARRLKAYIDGLEPVTTKIEAVRKRFKGAPVTATEPVFGYMAQALGLDMRNQRFQLAVMNDTEPSASDMAAFLDDLKAHKVKALLYNSQVTDDSTRHLLDVAHAAGVPVVGVTETEPAGTTYAGWMLGQLDALEKALAGAAS